MICDFSVQLIAKRLRKSQTERHFKVYIESLYSVEPNIIWLKASADNLGFLEIDTKINVIFNNLYHL